MSRLVKLPLFGNPSKLAEVDIDATEGAIVGVNLRRPDGTIVTEDDLGGGQLMQAVAGTRRVAEQAEASARRALDVLRGAIDQAISDANAEVERIRTEILASVDDLETQINLIDDAIFRVDTENPGLVQTVEGIKFDLLDSSGYVATQLRLITDEPDGIIASRLDALRATVEGYADGLVATEETARISADGVLTRRGSIVDALLQVVDPTDPDDVTTARSLSLEAIEQDISNVAGGLVATGLQVSSLQTTVNNPTTGVVATAGGLSALTTRVTSVEGVNTAQASQLSSISASLDDVSADVSSLSTVVVGPGTPGTPVPLLARYALRVNANGNVAGMVFSNNGTTSEVVFAADVFQISTPSLSAPVTPFQVRPDPDNGGTPTVFMTDVVIDNLTVDRINGGSVRSAWNIDNVDGQIRIGSGTNVKIIGAGFGTSGQFIEWFGPAAGPINEATAISYVKTNGDVFFSGVLAVGSVSNSRQTNSVAPSASVTLDHLSRGREVTVTVSYECQRSGTRTTNQSSPGTPSGSLSINVNGSSQTLTPTGDYFGDFDVGTGYSFAATLTGSATYTIPAAAAGTRTITASVASRSIGSPGGTSTSLDSFTQNITITTSEG